MFGNDIWDHLCQDVDPNKPNYVNNIADHPELIDINMIQGGGGGPGNSGDWFHVNGVHYNDELDQIRSFPQDSLRKFI